MDRPPNLVEEAAESVNPREQELSAPQPSESNALNEPNEALIRISQDKAQVLDGLHESIKIYLAFATSLQQVTFSQLVQDAMKVGKSEASNQERYQKKEFSRGGSSSGKGVRESQAHSIDGSTSRGIRQGPKVAPSFGRGRASGQGESLECPHYHKWHSGVYRVLTRGCFRCGSTDHFLENCPRESGDHRSLQGCLQSTDMRVLQMWKH